MVMVPVEGEGNATPRDPVKRPWTTPRLVVHGQIPGLTFGATSLKTAE